MGDDVTIHDLKRVIVATIPTQLIKRESCSPLLASKELASVKTGVR